MSVESLWIYHEDRVLLQPPVNCGIAEWRRRHFKTSLDRTTTRRYVSVWGRRYSIQLEGIQNENLLVRLPSLPKISDAVCHPTSQMTTDISVEVFFFFTSLFYARINTQLHCVAIISNDKGHLYPIIRYSLSDPFPVYSLRSFRLCLCFLRVYLSLASHGSGRKGHHIHFTYREPSSGLRHSCLVVRKATVIPVEAGIYKYP